MSTDFEVRCGISIGRGQTCGKEVGSATVSDRGWFDFSGWFQAPFDEYKNTVRFKCPRHGWVIVAHDVLRFNYRYSPKRFKGSKRRVIIAHRDD